MTKGVVHRDLKPANIVIASDGRARVLDFGLATLASEEGESRAEPLTHAGAVVGTIAYMSPEQSIGQPADARSDMFSFGFILYEMLTGARPYKGRTTAEHFHLLNYTPPPPLRAIQPAVSEALERIVMRMLQRRPEDRYADMRQVEHELRALAGEASSASPEQLDAWGLLHRAYHFWNHAFTFEGLEQALAQARRAVELDPGYAAAHAFLGLTSRAGC